MPITVARSEILALRAQALSAKLKVSRENPESTQAEQDVLDAREDYEVAFQAYTNPFNVSKWI